MIRFFNFLTRNKQKCGMREWIIVVDIFLILAMKRCKIKNPFREWITKILDQIRWYFFNAENAEGRKTRKFFWNSYFRSFRAFRVKDIPKIFKICTKTSCVFLQVRISFVTTRYVSEFSCDEFVMSFWFVCMTNLTRLFRSMIYRYKKWSFCPKGQRCILRDDKLFNI
jgi:hypothetical protein